MIYLMLNPDDITEVLGEVSDAQIRNELNMTQAQVNFKISRNAPFYKECLLVEKEFREAREENFFDEVMITENDKGDRWYATKDCEIYRVYKKSGKKSNLTLYKHHGRYTAKVNNREVSPARIFAKNFIFPKLDKNYVVKVNGDLKLENIEIVPIHKVCQQSGFMSSEKGARKRKPIALYEDGKIIKKWPSAYKAEKDLFMSHSSIRDICDGKVKNKIYDLRYV